MNQRDKPRLPPPDCREHRSIFLRSLALQASWNSQRMQHLGLLTTMVPWLRRQGFGLHETRKFCRDHFGYFNTNPYLANYLIGGLIRLETDAQLDGGGYERTIHGFKTSLGRALASLGDQLFWLGLQPGLLLLSVMIALVAPAPLALLPFVGFASVQLALRKRSLEVGYRLGMDIVDLLSAARWHRTILVCKRVGAVLTGSFAAFVVWNVVQMGNDPDRRVLAAGICATAAAALLLRRRTPGEIMILALLPLALILTYL